jgi:hypothetical protein
MLLSKLTYWISCRKYCTPYIAEIGRRLGDRFATDLLSGILLVYRRKLEKFASTIHPITGGNDIREKNKRCDSYSNLILLTHTHTWCLARNLSLPSFTSHKIMVAQTSEEDL